MVRYCIQCGRKNVHEGEQCQFCGTAFQRARVLKEPMQVVDEDDPRLSCPSTEEVEEMAGTIERLSNQVGQSELEFKQKTETIRGYRLGDIVNSRK